MAANPSDSNGINPHISRQQWEKPVFKRLLIAVGIWTCLDFSKLVAGDIDEIRVNRLPGALRNAVRQWPVIGGFCARGLLCSDAGATHFWAEKTSMRTATDLKNSGRIRRVWL
jgi:hypothetical protein